MSAWGNIEKPSESSFDDITSEQLANSLQEKEYGKIKDSLPQEDVSIPEETDSPLYEIDQTESDEVIAHMLQLEFNKEHNLMLKRTEEKFNKNSKVNISYLNFRAGLDEPDEPKKELDENRDFDRFVSVEKEYASIPRCGYKKVEDAEGSQIVTKHDMLMTSRINACRVLEFPPGIETGDTGGFDVKLNNKVYNSLRAHSHAFCSREKAKAHPKPQPK